MVAEKAASNEGVGTRRRALCGEVALALFRGMFAAAAIGIFLIPPFYVVFQRILGP